MKLADFLKRLRGKITGLNAISARFDILQMQLDRLMTITTHSNPGFTAQKPQPEVSSQNVLPLNPSTDAGSSLIEVLPGEKIRLVFLVITPETWPSLEFVWERAKNDNRFTTSVVVLKSAAPDIALMSLAKSQELLESKGVSYFTEQNFALDCYRPHVVLTTIPYDSLYPQNYKPELIVAKGCRLAYISYGLQVVGGVFMKRYSYDTEVPKLAWRVFARSRDHLVNFGRYCSKGNGHVVVTGHPRIESYRPDVIKLEHPVSAKSQDRMVILWTPHHNVLTRRKWSSFLDNYETILRLIDDRPDLFLLVRPHPFLRSRLAKLESWGEERVVAWFKTINEKDNVFVDTETDYRPAFEVSSALMTDAGSFLVEYLYTGKPICHLTGRDDIGLSEEARDLDCFYPGANEKDIADFLEKVIRNDDPMFGPRRMALHYYFGQENQTPSQTILDEIANEIGSRAPRVYRTELPPPSQSRISILDDGSNNFLAVTNFYQEIEQALRVVLRKHATGRFAADIGCLNGRFTEILAEHFEFTEATDPSEQFISEARESADCKGITNIAYTVERLDHAESLSTYDFVSGLGITSSLIDDEAFIKSIWKLKAAMRPGAKLLMVDTLSLSEPRLIERIGFKAIYRNVASYVGAFEIAGLSLLEEQVISKDDKSSLTNRLFVFAAVDRISSPIRTGFADGN